MKKVLLTLGAVCFSLIAVHISTAEIDLETAVGIWLFDEGKGGVATDLSGKGNDADLEKSPEWVEGKFGTALKFDGKASCVKTGQKLLDNLEEFTIITWVQTGDVNANRTGLVGQNDAPEFGFINPNSVNLWTPTAGGTQRPWEHKHDDGKWHHVGCVATTEYVHTYIDGEYTEVAGRIIGRSRYFSLGTRTSDINLIPIPKVNSVQPGGILRQRTILGNSVPFFQLIDVLTGLS